ncbi:MAG: HAD-IB family hydrolase [endosymbiont of Seepiophila jonesi]|uniref:Histidinol-phosphatase n=1 Tax=endosymbiont of Lamellibrachia luymesi TaxID=2200907 RepID=A0A370DY31_9GAMM|nr:MAG: HAD-IB family hydrolase [endosymbiont of Lamellibrachia luymesi]RDH93975.1 MAG: HAD-IB family hydrolase [endosymbiont of Seepiophila jonesi]
MALALFDLDNTLLAGDSDYLWGSWLVENGVVDGEFYERENERFYQEYKKGRLDILEFLRFSLRPLRDHEPGQLLKWRAAFLTDKIDPIISTSARQLLQKHRDAGDELMIITATNAFITTPIAERFGVENLIATEPEKIDGRYTGEVAGEPCFQIGKVNRLNRWLEEKGMDLQNSWFYSDSHNDIPLLERVDHPVAVDPDATLLRHAGEKDWPILRLHDAK